jgi:hypothetical protein
VAPSGVSDGVEQERDFQQSALADAWYCHQSRMVQYLRMPRTGRKSKKGVPKIKRTDPEQSAKFIKAAKELGLDESSGGAFEHVMDSLTKKEIQIQLELFFCLGTGKIISPVATVPVTRLSRCGARGISSFCVTTSPRANNSCPNPQT